MKGKLLCLFVILIIFSSFVLSKNKKKHKSHKKSNDKSAKENPRIKHVSEILQNYPQAKDNHDLWRNLDNRNFQKVSFGGIHGSHSYQPPQGGLGNGGFSHIASPHPKKGSSSVSRIIAGDLPSAGKSGSTFDLPSRKNVLQIDIPQSEIQTTTYSYNASTRKEPNMNLTFHGIEPSKPIYHGKFLELKNEILQKPKTVKVKSNPKKLVKRQETINLNKAKEDALNISKKVENTATTLLTQVHASPSQMSIPIHVSNKKLTNNLEFNKNSV